MRRADMTADDVVQLMQTTMTAIFLAAPDKGTDRARRLAADLVIASVDEPALISAIRDAEIVAPPPKDGSKTLGSRFMTGRERRLDVVKTT